MMKCGSSGSLKVGAVCVNSGTVGVVAAEEFDDEGGNDNDDAVDVLGVPVVGTVVGPVVVVAIVNAVVPVVVNGDDNDVVVLDGLLEVVVTC
jgi:hypothetical protein